MKTSITNQSAQEGLTVLKDALGNVIAAFQVERSNVKGTSIEVAGWHVGSGHLSFAAGDGDVNVRWRRHQRSDVAQAFNGAGLATEQCGFVAIFADHSRDVEVVWRLETGQELAEYRMSVPISGHSHQGPMGQKAQGWLEIAAATTVTNDAIVVGWALSTPNVRCWLETDHGDIYDLSDCYQYFRQDVMDAHGDNLGSTYIKAGFMAVLSRLEPGSRVKLMCDVGNEPTVLAHSQCTSMPNGPKDAAKWLLGISTPTNELHKRLEKIDVPVIARLTRAYQSYWPGFPIKVESFGQKKDKPDASIIVPLYGRIDFVEHQLSEFSRDSWFRENGELIYVVDDANIVDKFSSEARRLYDVYGVPFTWVWGESNRGFSGANNLGVQFATANYLIFLNSDAFPSKPGWIEELLGALATNPGWGAVGAQLLFADGSIQHSGMSFRFRQDLGIWTNHHPNMGLDPSLFKQKNAVSVPAVTGACIAISRKVFDDIKGWDTGYLIGDFEDSDFCLKIRARGLKIGYVPTASLVHLERQSFKTLGESGFRNRVVLLNAVRHQMRWEKVLNELSEK